MRSLFNITAVILGLISQTNAGSLPSKREKEETSFILEQEPDLPFGDLSILPEEALVNITGHLPLSDRLAAGLGNSHMHRIFWQDSLTIWETIEPKFYKAVQDICTISTVTTQEGEYIFEFFINPIDEAILTSTIENLTAASRALNNHIYLPEELQRKNESSYKASIRSLQKKEQDLWGQGALSALYDNFHRTIYVGTDSDYHTFYILLGQVLCHMDRKSRTFKLNIKPRRQTDATLNAITEFYCKISAASYYHYENYNYVINLILDTPSRLTDATISQLKNLIALKPADHRSPGTLITYVLENPGKDSDLIRSFTQYHKAENIRSINNYLPLLLEHNIPLANALISDAEQFRLPIATED